MNDLLQSQTYRRKTSSIEVTVRPVYQAKKSIPGEGIFVWSYEIEIANLSDQPVQVIGRSWRILDANGIVQESGGRGVVGKMPVVGPGESFAYTSFANLATTSGMMMGCYELETPNGDYLEVEIPPFSLDSPEPGFLPN